METRMVKCEGRNSDVDKDGLIWAGIKKYQIHDLTCKWAFLNFFQYFFQQIWSTAGP